MKILLVGASSDLGREIDRGAVARGHQVFGTCFRANGNGRLHPMDVTCESSVNATLSLCLESIGCPDWIIYCSAVDNPQLIIHADIAAWSEVINVNFLGALRVIKFCLPHLLKNGGGTIELVSSGMSTRSNNGATAYAASKAALNALALGVSKEYARSGVRCFSVSPGFFDAGLIRALKPSEKMRAASLLDMRRLGEAAEIAAFCLSTLESSSYLTGVNLEINGGMP